jgi:hypothetical protein
MDLSVEFTSRKRLSYATEHGLVSKNGSVKPKQLGEWNLSTRNVTGSLINGKT